MLRMFGEPGPAALSSRHNKCLTARDSSSIGFIVDHVHATVSTPAERTTAMTSEQFQGAPIYTDIT